jgi:hypothetical protein
MSISDTKILAVTKLLDKIEEVSSIELKAHFMNKAKIEETILKNFPSIQHRAESIANFCGQNVATYSDKGIVMFIDGCNHGERFLKGKDFRDLFARQMAYRLCSQIAYKQFLTDDTIESVLYRIDFNTFINSIFNYSKMNDVFDRLLSAQILFLSDMNLNSIVANTIFTSYQNGSQNLVEKKAKIESTLDELISSRIRLKRPTIITVLDDFETLPNENTGRNPFGSCLNELFTIVSDPNNVNVFEKDVCDQKCCRLCLVHMKRDIERFGKNWSSDKDFLTCIKSNGIKIDNIQALILKLKEICESRDPKLDFNKVLSSLKNDISAMIEINPGGLELAQELLNSIVKNPTMWCVLKGG